MILSLAIDKDRSTDQNIIDTFYNKWIQIF